MRDYNAFKSSAVRYWERRRIVYNIALVPPAALAYLLTAGIMYVGDPHTSYLFLVSLLFLLSALGANVCYSFAYALEFLFGSDDPGSRWLRFGRCSFFVGGILFGMGLAFIGGRNIAVMEFNYGLHGKA